MAINGPVARHGASALTDIALACLSQNVLQYLKSYQIIYAFAIRCFYPYGAKLLWIVLTSRNLHLDLSIAGALFVKLEELHIVTARKQLIHQNQPVAQYLHKIQPCML